MEEAVALIEAYIEGTLTEEEHRAFAERLDKEPALQKQLELYQDSRSLLEHAVGLRVKQQLQQIQRPETRVKPLNRQWLRWGSVAASVMLIMAAGLWWIGRPSQNYESYFEAYGLVGGLRSPDNTGAMWQEAYLRQEYDLAKGILAQIDEEDLGWVEAQFYLGNIALSEKRPLEAIAPLKVVLNAQSPRFATAAEWFLLLAYWGSGEATSAQALAEDILSDEQHPYFEQVKRISKQLE